MAVRIISNPEDVTPHFAADSVSDLDTILTNGYDKQGTSALVVPSSEVYMLDGQKKWVRLKGSGGGGSTATITSITIEDGKLVTILSDGTRLESPVDVGLTDAYLADKNLVIEDSDGTNLTVPVLDQQSQTKLNDLPPITGVGNGLAIDQNGQLNCQFSIVSGGSAANGN